MLINPHNTYCNQYTERPAMLAFFVSVVNRHKKSGYKPLFEIAWN